MSNDTAGYATAEELSKMVPVRGVSGLSVDDIVKAARDSGLIVIAYDKADVENVGGKQVTDEQYKRIAEYVENDDLLWQCMFESVQQAVDEVTK